MSYIFTTELRDNYIYPNPVKPKPSRREAFLQKAYEENARNILIQHELKEKEITRAALVTEHMEQYSRIAPPQVDFTHHIRRHPLYAVDDAITFWNTQPENRKTNFRKNTSFSRPIAEELDQQFR